MSDDTIWTEPDQVPREVLFEANKKLIARLAKADARARELETTVINKLVQENERLVAKCNRLSSQMRRLHWISAKVFAETHEAKPERTWRDR